MQALLLAAFLAVHPAATATVDDSLPTWSPDGKHIAFARITGRGTSVFVVRPDGSGLRRIGSSVFSYPAWSPDGKTLAFTQPLPRNGSAIAIARPGVKAKRLALGGSPAWAPKGGRIAFVRGDGIAVVDVRSRRVREVRLVTPLTARAAGRPAWSPDGRRLATTLGGNVVGVVSVRGGSVLLLGAGHAPAWSPDGALIAAACLYGELVWFFSPAQPGEGCGIGIPEAETGRPQWSRDARRILASGCFFDECAIWIQPRGARTKIVLGPGVSPSWSPNGRAIVFARAESRSAPSRLYVMDADGSRVRPLFP